MIPINLKRGFRLLVSRYKSLSSIYLISGIVFTTIPIIILCYLWISSRYNTFNLEIEQLKTSYIESKQVLLKDETNRVIDYINYVRSIADRRTKRTIKERGNDGIKILNGIYEIEQPNFQLSRFKKLAATALPKLPRNFYSIIDFSGNEVFELNIKGSDSVHIPPRKDILHFIQNNTSGFIVFHIKDKYGEKFQKVVYIKIFDPLKWILISGEFENDSEKEIQLEILERISLQRFGTRDYFTVVTYDGIVLMNPFQTGHIGTNQWELTDIKGNKFIQLWRKEVKNKDGGFVYYFWKDTESEKIVPKYSFAKGYAPWKWMISAVANIDDLENQIASQKSQLSKNVIFDITKIIFIAILLIMIIVMIARNISRKLKGSITEFNAFFEKAASQSIKIDAANIWFTDFKVMANAANLMVDERRQIEDAFKKEKAYFEQLFENSPEAIVMCDMKNQVLMINKEFVELFGYSPEELIGCELDLFLNTQETIDEAHIIAHKVSQGDRVEIETKRKHKTGQMIDISHMGAPIWIENQQIGTFGIYRDISERKAYERDLKVAKEKAEDAARLKDSFLENMSHEIRTPMNAILGFSNLLRINTLKEKDRNEYINLISKSGDSLLGLIDDIIDLSKIGSGQMTIRPSVFVISNLLQQLHVFYEKEKINVGKEHIELSLKIAPELMPLAVQTDENRLKQILINILGNALKFTDKGFIEFGFSIKDNKTILFYVKDTGIGIHSSNRDVIFERFRQVNESTARFYGGTGLGLALSRSLVELLGGAINFDSEPGKGSCFYFTIPYIQPSVNRSSEEEAIVKIKNTDFSGRTILIAEDVESNYLYIEAVLAKTKVQLVWAENGKKAVELFQKLHSVDIVLMDIQMPEMDGYEATRLIKKINPKVPIIAQTAFAMAGEQERSQNAGCDEYISKPIKAQTLIAIISKYMSR